MRYLGLALYAEGPTDYQFLSPVLRRVAEDLCLREADHVVTIGDVRAIDAPRDRRQADRAGRIRAAATAAEGAFDVLFIHADGANDPFRAREEQVDPAIRSIGGGPRGTANGIVAVIPVRETEAWALADGEALRGALGTILDDDRLGLPARIAGVESLPDPKQTLRQVCINARGRRRLGRRAERVLDSLGDRVRLECLRAIPAFQIFEGELRQVLRDLHYLR